MLKKIHYLLLLAHRFSWKKPFGVVSLVVISFLISLVGANKLQFLLSIDDLIDPDFQTYESLKKVNNEFKDKNTILLSLESKELFNKELLCELQSWILKTAEERHDLIQIQSTFGIRQAKIDSNRFEMRSFLDLNCLNQDPETQKISQAFTAIHQSPWQGILTSNKDYSLTVNFIVHDPEDKKFGSIDINIVDRLQKSFNSFFQERSHLLQNIKVYWGGITTYQSYLRKSFDQTQALNGLMFIISLLIFRIFLGSWKAGFLFNLTLLISIVISYGIMGFLNIPVDVLTNSTGLMMIVGCLEDFVFIVFGMLKFNWSMRKSMRKFLVPAFFTSLTTAIGFGSLVTSELSIIRRFGLISAFASMLEWSIVFLFLPALFRYKPKWQDLKFSSKILSLKFNQNIKIPKYVSMILCLLILIPILWSHEFVVKDSPDSFFFKEHVVIKTTEHFKESRGWVVEVSLLFNPNNSPQENNQLVEQIRKLKTIERVEDQNSVEDFLTANLDPSDRNMVLNFWRDSLFAKRLESDTGQKRAQVFLNSMEMEDVKKLIKESEQICKDKCTLTGGLISYNEFSVKILNTLFSSLGMSIILVILILFLIRAPLKPLQILSLIVTSIWGPLVLLSLFVVFKIPMSFVTCICASLLVGLAGDNAIQFIFTAKKSKLDKSVAVLAEASLIITLGMMLLVSVFMLSEIASLSVLGIYILIGFTLGYIGDVWLLKGLIKND